MLYFSPYHRQERQHKDTKNILQNQIRWTLFLGGYKQTRCNKIVPNIFGSMIINPYLSFTFVTEGGPSILQPALYFPPKKL